MMFFTLSYPTGLSIYFIISSLLRVVQYYFIKTNGAATGDKGKLQLKPRKQ